MRVVERRVVCACVRRSNGPLIWDEVWRGGDCQIFDPRFQENSSFRSPPNLGKIPANISAYKWCVSNEIFRTSLRPPPANEKSISRSRSRSGHHHQESQADTCIAMDISLMHGVVLWLSIVWSRPATLSTLISRGRSECCPRLWESGRRLL